jgi:hypothetical protein
MFRYGRKNMKAQFQTLKSLVLGFAAALGPRRMVLVVLIICAVAASCWSFVGHLGVFAWVMATAAALAVALSLLIVGVFLRFALFPPFCIERYPNGRVQAKGPHYQGDRQEHWTLWNETGWKECEGHYITGFEGGIWTFYYPDGQVCARGELDGWRRVGDWEFWDDHRFPVSEANFLSRYPNGPSGKFPARGPASQSGSAGDLSNREPNLAP